MIGQSTRQEVSMSDNKGSDAASIPDAAQHDWFLQSLVNIANTTALNFGVTLQVGGFLVSGVVVSGKAYFAAMGQQIANGYAQNPELATQMRKMFATFESAYPNGQGQADQPVPQFIHLQNARFFSTDSTPVPGNEGIWWRGRISEVSGVVIGILNVSD
jgi:hypothetical protein